MFRFEHPSYLYTLLLIPALVVIYLLMRRWRKKALNAFAEKNVINLLMPDLSESKAKWKVFLQLSAFFFLVIGIANPQLGSKLEEVKREGVDIMIVLDVSNSMNAEDLAPTRLERAKQMLSKLVDNLKGDRIGMVVFAGEAFIQLPITTDYAAAKLFISTITTDIILTQGTAIGTALQLATKGLETKEQRSKIIVLMTDGENHEDDALSATQEAAAQGIIVHTAGIGSPEGAPIPVYRNEQRVGFKKDNEGNTVVTQLNESMLQQIAAAGNGIYVRATNSQNALNRLQDQINKLEKTELSAQQYTEYESRFQYFIAIALLLLTIDFFISRRKSPWLSRFSLFGESSKLENSKFKS